MEPIYADKLYEFLTEMLATAQSQGDEEAAQRIDRARKHYMVPLQGGKTLRPPVTSEFLGESMLALRDVLARSRKVFSSMQIEEAGEYADSIKQQWFSRR